MLLFLSDFLKLFFLLTPFFVLSMFITLTGEMNEKERKGLAIRTMFASMAASLLLIFFGNWIFSLFGITLDAFRIGAGALLFLAAVGLVNGKADSGGERFREETDIAVVPLAIPVTVGPATTGALLVMGAESARAGVLVLKCVALVLALALIGGMLYCAVFFERILKKRGIVILSKLTGLILAALAAQMVFTGIKNFL